MAHSWHTGSLPNSAMQGTPLRGAIDRKGVRQSMKPISEERRKVVLTELNRLTVDAAIKGAQSIADGSADIANPPNGSLTEREVAALARLSVDDDTRTALCKVIADSIASAAVGWLCVLDAVGDPETGDFDPWLGVALAEPTRELEQPFLHDDYFGAWWDYTDREDVV